MDKRSTKKYENDWPVVAICYDFDKTLSPKDMQEFSLIPKLSCSPEEFWAESNRMSQKDGMDKILAYMRLILQKAGDNIRITKNDFKQLGKDIELFPGVDTWFTRIDKMALELEVNVEHYIISAGLKEIIEGTPLKPYFQEIYASSFLYDTYKRPIWPRQVVNYTTKTQYLFRISKNCLDLSDEDAVNEYINPEERRIPFSNFIYIGDSETDIPAMKIIKNGGGISIGVYNPHTKNMDRVRKLLRQRRIDFLMPADYTEGSKLEQLVINALSKIRESYTLTLLNRRQSKYVGELDYIEGFADGYIEYLKDENGELDAESAKLVKDRFKQIRKDLHIRYGGFVSAEEIDDFMNKIDAKRKDAIEKKNKRKA